MFKSSLKSGLKRSYINMTTTTATTTNPGQWAITKTLAFFFHCLSLMGRNGLQQKPTFYSKTLQNNTYKLICV